MLFNGKVNSVFVMPKEVVKYLGNAKKSELKLIIYLFSKGNEFSIEKAAQDLSETPEAINQALAFWRGAGVISENEEAESPEKNGDATAPLTAEQKKTVSESPADKSYTTLEVAEARKNDAQFRHLAEYTEKTTGELMNASKLASLLYLYDNLGMQCDVIMGIVAHCVSAGKNKIRYIVKTAEGIHNDGVVTYKELECYLAQKKHYAEYESMVKRVIGAGERAFTPNEQKLVKTWETEYKADEALVAYAYERTIALITKPSIPYMSKILENWHKNGIKTAEEARRLAESQGGSSKTGTPSGNDERTERMKKAGFDVSFEDMFEQP